MVRKIKSIFVLALPLFSSIALCNASVTEKERYQTPFYIGGMVGYGSTTWEGLVPTRENKNSATSMSTPLHVTEGGRVLGWYAGCELTPYFALETSYMRYPDAKVIFDPMSLFSFNNNDRTEFTTNTKTVNLLGKVMLFFPETQLRIYSSAGVASVHRHDLLASHWNLSPSFGAGVNYRFTDHFMGELGGNYTAGYGESRVDPTESYIPFLYSVTLRLAYCF